MTPKVAELTDEDFKNLLQWLALRDEIARCLEAIPETQWEAALTAADEIGRTYDLRV